MTLPFTFYNCEPDDPWHRCLTYFLQSLYDRSHSRGTVGVYQYNLRVFFATSANAGPPKHPTDYTREDVEWFLHRPTHTFGGTPSISTVNQRLTVIASFYRYAATFTITGDDGHPVALFSRLPPTTGIHTSHPRHVYRALSEDELRRLFDAIPTNTVIGLRDRAIFLFYFWTARRRMEVARLRFGDLEYGTIVDEDGTRRQGWLYHFRGKGRSEQDDISELPLPAKRALDLYLEASDRLATIRPEDPLFVAIGPPQGGGKPKLNKPFTGSTIQRALKAYAKDCGLSPKRVTIHSFRHTSVRLRYAAGEDIRSLQRLLRHQNLSTTDTYLQSLAGSADPGAQLLEERFGEL